MLTWLQLWPLLMMPTVMLSVIAALPTFAWQGRVLGGGVVREYYLNHFVLPLLPAETGAQLVAWFSTADGFQEWLLAFAVSINLNALMLPVLYGLGAVVIGVSSWVSKKNIDLKRQAMR